MYLASEQLFHNFDLIGTLHTDYFGHHNLTITQPILKLPSPIVCDNFQCQLVKKKKNESDTYLSSSVEVLICMTETIYEAYNY